jgi:methyl-accepting chemotaxis protein
MTDEANENPRTRRRLRNFWLNPQYQARYILWMLTLGMALTLANATFLTRYATQNYEFVLSMLPTNVEIRAVLQQELYRVIRNLVIVSAIFTVAMGLIALMLSHRTAGPLYQFSQVFRDIAGGKRSARIRLRPNDDFRDVADDFNRMMDGLDDDTK